MSTAPEVMSAHPETPMSGVDVATPGSVPVDRGTRPMNVAIVGTGYVGLTCGVCLAELGFRVTCADVDPEKIAALERGQVTIHEPGCSELVLAGRSAGRLAFCLGAPSAVADADIVLMCLPTPQGADGSADVSCLLAAAEEIGPHLRPGAVVVNKSTVPVGAAAAVAARLGREDVDVAANPEFLREGSAIDDFMCPDRVVIGADDPAVANWVALLYDGLDTDIFITGTSAAETIKYVANGFLAMKVSFANAVATLCEAVGADVFDVMRGIGSDRRIGHEFLRPGPGWGGSCFPKDSRALVSIGVQHGYDFSLMRAAIAVNDEQAARLVAKISLAAGRDPSRTDGLSGTRVGVLGLTFKADTDDLRDSPSMRIIGELRRRGASVIAYDPTTSGELRPAQSALLGDLSVVGDPADVADGADVVAVLTEWPEFRGVIDDRFARAMRGGTVVDARNLLDPVAVAAAGLAYLGVGR